MDLDLTPDAQLFQSTTRDYLEQTMPIHTVHELAKSGAGFDRDWWRQGAELGWTSMLVPEALGGGTVSGSPVAELALVAEELGRACAPGPLITISAVLTGLVRSGEKFADTITSICGGETIASWAFYKPNRGWTEYGVLATPDGDGCRLTGTADRVEAGDQTDVYLVTASSPDGPVQALIPVDTPGVSIDPAWTLDPVRHTAHVSFADVRVTEDNIVQRGAEAEAAVRAQFQVAAALAAAEMAGAVEETFEFTLQWMFDRYTFGRQLASYQALKHRMADNKTWLEACHAAVATAAHAIDDEPTEAHAAEAVSAAKSFVGARAPEIVQDCVQLHGGIGVTWEHNIHLYLRRVTLDAMLFGTPEDHRRMLADLLEAKEVAA